MEDSVKQASVAVCGCKGDISATMGSFADCGLLVL